MGTANAAYLTSIYLDPPAEEITNLRLLNRWKEVEANEVRYKEYFLDDAEIVDRRLWHRGTRGTFRSARGARQGHQGRLAAPDHRQPVPLRRSSTSLPDRRERFLVVEMNTGQMLEDVRLAVARTRPGRVLWAAWAAWFPSRTRS